MLKNIKFTLFFTFIVFLFSGVKKLHAPHTPRTAAHLTQLKKTHGQLKALMDDLGGETPHHSPRVPPLKLSPRHTASKTLPLSKLTENDDEDPSYLESPRRVSDALALVSARSYLRPPEDETDDTLSVRDEVAGDRRSVASSEEFQAEPELSPIEHESAALNQKTIDALRHARTRKIMWATGGVSLAAFAGLATWLGITQTQQDQALSSADAQNADLQAQVEALQTAVGTNRTDLTDAEKKASLIEQLRLKAAQTNLNATNAAIGINADGSLTATPSGLEAKVSALQTTVGTAGDGTAANPATGLVAAAASDAAGISALQTAVGGNTSAITGLQTKLGATDTALGITVAADGTVTKTAGGLAATVDSDTAAISGLQRAVGTASDAASATGSLYARSNQANATDLTTAQALTSLGTAVANKVSTADLASGLATKADQSAVDTLTQNLATETQDRKTDVQNLKTDRDRTNTNLQNFKTEVGLTYATQSALTTGLTAAKTYSDNTYATQSALSDVSGIASRADSALGSYNATTGTYSGGLTEAVAGKANASALDYYLTKADASDTYATQEYVNQGLTGKASDGDFKNLANEVHDTNIGLAATRSMAARADAISARTDATLGTYDTDTGSYTGGLSGRVSSVESTINDSSTGLAATRGIASRADSALGSYNTTTGTYSGGLTDIVAGKADIGVSYTKEELKDTISQAQDAYQSSARAERALGSFNPITQEYTGKGLVSDVKNKADKSYVDAELATAKTYGDDTYATQSSLATVSGIASRADTALGTYDSASGSYSGGISGRVNSVESAINNTATGLAATRGIASRADSALGTYNATTGTYSGGLSGRVGTVESTVNNTSTGLAATRNIASRADKALGASYNATTGLYSGAGLITNFKNLASQATAADAALQTEIRNVNTAIPTGRSATGLVAPSAITTPY